MPECPHEDTYWTEWQEIAGITRPMKYRDKKCRDCGRTVDREAR